jgi:hypothetical protein
MQRRTATVYFVFFLVMGASAFSVISLAQTPSTDLSGEELAQGDSLTAEGVEYTVSTIEAEEGDGHGGGGAVVGEMVWTNESVVYTGTVSDNATLAPAQFTYDGADAHSTATLEDGDTVQFNGSEATVEVNETGSNIALVQNGSAAAAVAVNETLAYQGNTTTLFGVSEGQATLIWGEPYTVHVDVNSSTVRAVQTFDVGQRLAADPVVENETITRSNGERYVVYQANGTTELLSSYLPTPDESVLTEGATVTYARTDATVDNVSSDGARFRWTAPRENTIELEEGSNVTLQGQQHVVHFPDSEHVVVSPDVSNYFETRQRQDAFHQRMNGFWGVTILSGTASVLIVGLAFLPTKE